MSKLNERVAIITEENISRLSHLYGEVDIDNLSAIVNQHLKAAIDEIEEESFKQKESDCSRCEYMKMYNYGKKIYYCNHENRADEMGKLSMENLQKRSPEWCPLKKKNV